MDFTTGLYSRFSFIGPNDFIWILVVVPVFTGPFTAFRNSVDPFDVFVVIPRIIPMATSADNAARFASYLLPIKKKTEKKRKEK